MHAKSATVAASRGLFCAPDCGRSTQEVSMAHLKALALVAVAVAALGTGTSAFAGTGTFTTTVTPLTTNVTYSTPAAGKVPPLNTVVGYTVAIASDPTNTNNTNHIVFIGTTTVTDAAEAAEFGSADGATCSTIANPAGS
ncbi:MAG TPA: hypothetical protein VJO99_11125, partial [Burkholderiaceae bacterium]|nr:hypothetical protein [Burkholderiaceae bacterium]